MADELNPPGLLNTSAEPEKDLHGVTVRAKGAQCGNKGQHTEKPLNKVINVGFLLAG